MDEARRQELKKKLSPEQYKVAVEKSTEAPFSGKYVFSSEEGVYKCFVCGNPLFSSESKFETKIPGLMGWPSFEQALPGAVKLGKDDSHGMNRTEVLCSKCGSHVGHVFDDNSEGKTGKHYCVNCVSLDLKKE